MSCLQAAWDCRLSSQLPKGPRKPKDIRTSVDHTSDRQTGGPAWRLVCLPIGIRGLLHSAWWQLGEAHKPMLPMVPIVILLRCVAANTKWDRTHSKHWWFAAVLICQQSTNPQHGLTLLTDLFSHKSCSQQVLTNSVLTSLSTPILKERMGNKLGWT